MSVRVADAVAGRLLWVLLVVPSTSQRSAGANGTNRFSGTDQVLLWMYTRGATSFPSHRENSSAARSAWPGANASASGGPVVPRSRPSASHDRSLVCHGQTYVIPSAHRT